MSLRPNLGLNGFCTCIQSGLPTGQFASKLPVKESTEHTYDAVSESNDAMDGPEHAGIKERPVSSDSSGKSVILHFFFYKMQAKLFEFFCLLQSAYDNSCCVFWRYSSKSESEHMLQAQRVMAWGKSSFGWTSLSYDWSKVNQS